MTHTREVMKLAVSLRMKLRNNGKEQVGGPQDCLLCRTNFLGIIAVVKHCWNSRAF